MNKNTNNSKDKPSTGLIHLTINTGHCVTHDPSFLWPCTYELMKPMLCYHGGSIPGLPEFTVGWHSHCDAHRIAIAKRGKPVILCALASGSNAANKLWDSLVNFSFPILTTDSIIPTQPNTTPWLAVVLLQDALALSPFELGMLGSFESCLGLAMLRHIKESNT